ncbi:YbaL family putative K(+) efflux transporter [Demequina muriae]|uniref:YbaL family putative K(+) efflux transporter n=1 Tax=Demequina muriae TaxID=3051664 RepID=A0ABT8GEA1_9MICO|nr:YbaL family putative K(+) efflux transporter [Demequina sp. EGI L300058]MDN4479756.1 YbaL family putative K(+) efflux transporter [Demequina sp. EGI L300058]
MLHHAPLLTTIAAGLVVAFGLGFLAQKARLSPIVGYLAAGIVIGPFTPGYEADTELAMELAEIGVILLMFGVGLHFSFRELLAVRKVALPGAIAQMTAATALGTGLGLWIGWDLGASMLFGLALSVASTVVMLRALEDEQLLDTRGGHIAVGWLIVEDLAMVIALVMIPVLASDVGGPGALAGELAWTIVKVGAFVALMVVVGRRAIPWLLGRVADSGSRELFTLSVLALGIGVAVGAAYLFDVSFALGAFFAGMILRESDLSHRAAEDSLPLRQAFAVLFFVAVGMLFDWRVIIEQPLALLGTFLVIVAGKTVVAFAIVRALKYSKQMALVVAAALAQIGEFSFILVTLGADLEILSGDARDLVLGGAILSIIANPLLFAWATRAYRETEDVVPIADAPREYEGEDHVLVVGFGRVGARVAEGLWARGVPTVVVDDDERRVETLREQGREAILGNAVRAKVLMAAGIDAATVVIVAIPDPLNAGAIVSKARAMRPEARIIGRGHRDVDVEYLTEMGADRVIVGVHETADLMVAEADSRA